MNSSPEPGYMLFCAGGHRYAISVDSVDEISEMLPEYPIPGAPRFVRGAVNIHGKIAALLDLSMFLGKGQQPTGRNILLLRRQGASLALLVEQMERIIYSSQINHDDEASTAYLQLPEGTAMIIDAEVLINSVEKAIS